jgi:hypothetical protein
MPRRAFGFTTSELPIVQQCLSRIPKNAYAYLAIHGAGSEFKIFEKNAWKTIPSQSLAECVFKSDSLYNGLTIVLLTCSDTSSTRKFADALGDLDEKAKRKLRPVIGWDGSVTIYENGFIDGDGVCRLFTPFAGSKVQPMTQVPRGNPYSYPSEQLNSVILGRAKDPELLALSQQYTGDKSIDNYHKTLKDLRKDTKIIFDTLAANKAALQAWFYLKDKLGNNSMTSNMAFLKNTVQILNNCKSPEFVQAACQVLLDDYLPNGAEKEKTITKLAAISEKDTTAFKLTIQTAGTKISVVTALGADFRTRLSILQIHLGILNTVGTQADLVKELTAYAQFWQEQIVTGKNPTYPIAQTLIDRGLTAELLEKLRVFLSEKDLIGGITATEDACYAITRPMYRLIGNSLSHYDHFIKITDEKKKPKGFFSTNSTKGSIFESWGLNHINDKKNKALDSLAKPAPAALLDKNPAKSGLTITVDFHFMENNEIVAVEFKHAEEVTSAQLKTRAANLIAKGGKVKRYVYIFAEKPDKTVATKITSALADTRIFYFLNGILTALN